MSKVPFNTTNIKKCLCVKCPVQKDSNCVKEKMKMELGDNPKKDDVPGLYCSSGKAYCSDLDTSKMCMCGKCPIWKECSLAGGNPKGYFCRDGMSM